LSSDNQKTFIFSSNYSLKWDKRHRCIFKTFEWKIKQP